MRKSIPIILTVGLFAVSSILARPGSHRSFGGVGKRSTLGGFHQKANNPFRFKSLDRIYDKRNQLNLTDEQIEKIKNLIYAFRTAQAEQNADIEKARIKLQHLKSEKSDSVESVMEAIDHLHQMEAASDKARYRFRIDIRSILTEEQLEKLEKLRKTRRSNSHRFLPEIERQMIFDENFDSQ